MDTVLQVNQEGNMKGFTSPRYNRIGIMIVVLVIAVAVFVAFGNRIQSGEAAANKTSALPIHALNYWLDSGTAVPLKTSGAIPIHALNYWIDGGTSVPSKSISSMPIHALNYWVDGGTRTPSIANGQIPVTKK